MCSSWVTLKWPDSMISDNNLWLPEGKLCHHHPPPPPLFSFCHVSSPLLWPFLPSSHALPSAPWLTGSFGATGRSGTHGPGQRINISSRSQAQSSHWAMHNHEFNSCTACSLHIFATSYHRTLARHLNAHCISPLTWCDWPWKVNFRQ